MVGKIYEIKNRALEALEKQMGDKGAERMDPELVDAVKDLAEAEKSCWEAEYYRSVVEAMNGSSGYMPMGYQGMRAGYQNQYGSGGNGRRGYSGSYGYQDHMEALRQSMQNATPEERERMRQELRGMTGGA